MVQLLGTLLVLALAASPVAAQNGAVVVPSAGRCKIVVMTLVGRALPPDDAEVPLILTETLAREVGAVSHCDVVAQSDITAMLDFASDKAACGGDSDSCLAEVGSALGADRVVAGTVAKLGTEYIVNARLMNVKLGAVESRSEEPVSGSPEKLRRAAQNVGRRLFGVADVAANGDGGGGGAGVSPLVWVGGAAAGLGVATAVVGGIVAAGADSKLADPTATNKQQAKDDGQGAVLVGLLGGAVGLIGTVVMLVAFVE